MSRVVAAYVLSVTSVVLASTPLAAKPLASEICANIKVEINELEGKGVRAALAKGPATARTLSAEQLATIRRLLDLDAQSIFRCPLDRPYASLREEAAEEKDMIEPEPGSGGVAVSTAAAAAAAKAAQPKAAPAKKAAAAPLAKPAAVPAAAAATPAQSAPTPVAAPPVKARPKSKSSDAYKPPASGDPNVTPLQDQLPKAQQ